MIALSAILPAGGQAISPQAPIDTELGDPAQLGWVMPTPMLRPDEPRPKLQRASEGLGTAFARYGDGFDLHAQVAASLGARISIAVPVSPAVLPATVRMLGAELTNTAGGGKRPTLTVAKPMVATPLRMERAPLLGESAPIGQRGDMLLPPGRHGSSRP